MDDEHAVAGVDRAAEPAPLTLVIWGAGELGTRVALGWHRGPVLGYTATTRRHASLKAAGIQPFTGTPDLPTQDTVLLLALPGHANQANALRQLQSRPIPVPQRVVLISTTGYYGTPAGRVDEMTPAGEADRCRSIAATENLLWAWAGERGVAMRMGGLYGPGRGPIAALARRGTVKPGPANRTLPLIHYADAARAVLAALVLPEPAPVYLAVTPPCPTRGEFCVEACRRLGLEPPTFTAPCPGPPARYDVSRLRRDLLPRPAYPDWQTALDLT